ncbi:CDP-glycerol glycerophosphotransferase family protein [Shewanella olleyana]|uniref:CDP-glycerol glycerophosphotransferase family protein n=1 Tax=Shewanella olleyana TaxID=135626 RepID=UPI00200DC725|nr:CDP-glycerol glycerophosphotransferase family protein [Shewanella olleyana]MCL1067025.1 CDP-glycerol glycerophosphotransferase family protein [Shewanella olleyana]
MYKSILRKVLSILDLVLPKKNVVCFFITARTSWDPNQQVLFAKFKSKFEVIVIDGNDVSRSSPYKTLKCFYKIYRSKVIIFDHSLPIGLVEGKHLCINVWHGSPIKRIRCLLKECFTQQFLDYQSTVTNLLISNSPFDSVQMQSCFNVTEEKMLSSGLPRNAYLTCTNEQLSEIDIYDEYDLVKNISSGYSKVILWAPTYRGDSHQFNDPLNLSQHEEQLLHRYLEESNSLLLVRYHKFSSCSKSSFFLHDNIRDVSNIKNQNILLREVDVLITDYSSIWIDYMLLRRPIVFYCADLDSYELNHGFIHDFQTSIPSKMVIDFMAVLDLLKQEDIEVLSSDFERLYNRYHMNSNANETILSIENKINSHIGL